jgi:hypothetical protein
MRMLGSHVTKSIHAWMSQHGHAVTSMTMEAEGGGCSLALRLAGSRWVPQKNLVWWGVCAIYRSSNFPFIPKDF